MDLLRPDQILTAAAFLGGLGLLWWLVIRNRGVLTDRIAQDRRLRVLERLALGPGDHALILRVDARDFLLVRVKGAPALLHPLAGDPVADRAEAAQ
nr:flagellar biosynthetic protein FliO [Paracoccus saliphilus]